MDYYFCGGAYGQFGNKRKKTGWPTKRQKSVALGKKTQKIFGKTTQKKNVIDLTR